MVWRRTRSALIERLGKSTGDAAEWPLIEFASAKRLKTENEGT